MKTENELNKDILKISMTINEKFPELSNFIEEMPVTIPNVVTPEINFKHLQNYFESLCEMLAKYETNRKIIVQ